MRRAVIAPLLSFVMPGLGQLVNRQAGKGVLLVMATTMVFLAALGIFAFQFNKAVATLSLEPDKVQQGQAMAALHEQLISQGVGWLWIIGIIYLIILIYAVFDARRAGVKIDSVQPGEAG